MVLELYILKITDYVDETAFCGFVRHLLFV